MTSSWTWLTHTEPFSELDQPDRPAAFVVEQIADRVFRIPLDQGFQYNPPAEAPIRVTRQTLPTTDFASIPSYMSWFVSRYGRHTPAALVHDQLVTDGMAVEARVRADRRFLEMMDSLDVPPVRSRVMWSAVSLATRWHGSTSARIGIVLWGAAATTGISLLAYGIATQHGLAIVAALALPAVGALLWGSQYPAGVIGGYALPVVVLPAAASMLGYGSYWVIESAVRLARKVLPHNRREDLPRPVAFHEK
jgi:hypothetical protein